LPQCGRVKPLFLVLAVQILLGLTLVTLVVTDNVPFVSDDDGGAAAAVPTPKLNRFDGQAAMRSVRRQVALGPRPAGSAASRRLARRIRGALPRGRFQAVPGGLRNVIGVVPGRDRTRKVVVGAHYDTKDLPGFVGANDGASGTAVLTGIARSLKPGRIRPTVVFIAFDGEESPRGAPDEDFERRGLRGSKVAAPRHADAEAMVLLDFVGERNLRIPREQRSDPGLWRKLRAAARRAGVGRVFPNATSGGVLDDHVPFQREGVRAIDLIDFEFACFHRRCDDLRHISPRSMDAVGETVLELLATL